MKLKYYFTIMVILAILISLGTATASENATAISIDDSVSLDSISEDAVLSESYDKVDLSINVDVKPSYEDGVYNKVGTVVPWTITLNVTGGTSHNTKVLEVFSNNLGYVSHTNTMGTYDPETRTWTIGDLTASDNASLTIFTKLKTAGTYVNKAYALTGDEDANLLNNFLSTSMKTGSSKITSNITETSDDRAGAQHNVHQASTSNARFAVADDSSKNQGGGGNTQSGGSQGSGSQGGSSNGGGSQGSGSEGGQSGSGSGTNHQTPQRSTANSVSKEISLTNIFNMIDDAKPASQNNLSEPINHVLAYDYTQIPILIFVIFLIALATTVGYGKIKSKS